MLAGCPGCILWPAASIVDCKYSARFNFSLYMYVVVKGKLRVERVVRGCIDYAELALPSNYKNVNIILRFVWFPVPVLNTFERQKMNSYERQTKVRPAYKHKIVYALNEDYLCLTQFRIYFKFHTKLNFSLSQFCFSYPQYWCGLGSMSLVYFPEINRAKWILENDCSVQIV